MRFLGEQNKTVMLCESGTYANPSGAGVWVGYVQDNSVEENINMSKIRYHGNMSRNIGKMITGPKDYTGGLTYYPQDFRMLYYAMGSVYNTSGPVMTHNISELNGNQLNGFTNGPRNPWISFTLEDSKTAEVAGSNFIRTVKGCVVDEFGLKIAEGEIAEASVSWIAQDCVFSSGTATSVTAVTDIPYLWRHCKLQIPSGTVLDNHLNIEFNVKNNFVAPHYCNGSEVVGVPIVGNREYSVPVNIHMDSVYAKTLYDQYYLGGSEFNALLDLTIDSNRYCIITMSGCRIETMKIPSPFEGPAEQSFTIAPTSCSAITKDTIYRYTAW